VCDLKPLNHVTTNPAGVNGEFGPENSPQSVDPAICAGTLAGVEDGYSASSMARLVQHALARLRRTRLFGQAFLSLFRILQACGISVLPNHFYWPIPDVRTLERGQWRRRTPAIDLKLPNQVQFASHVVPLYAEELEFASSNSPHPTAYHRNNGMFEAVDAEVAYSLVRYFKPRRIVEIGGGFSTRLLAHALRMNDICDGHRGELISVEPYPDPVMRAGIPGLTRLIPHRVQDVSLELFDALDAGDILFIDSSHVVTVGSDVVFEFLEIFPRLRPGVMVHLHDIFYPSDYPREAVLNFLWFWSEQYLLEVLLRSNPGFEVVWSSSAMQMFCEDELQRAFPAWNDSYLRMSPQIRRFLPTADQRRVWPSSFWMRWPAPMRAVAQEDHKELQGVA
jgi:predicted O-methyltransferase YrrM